jgi:hypothetical protein
MNLFNSSSLNRRGFLRNTATAGLATGMATLAGGLLKPFAAEAASANDIAVLQFALNLEYLEAEYYSYGLTGAGLSAELAKPPGSKGLAGSTIVKMNPQVTFTNPLFQGYAAEITADEVAHVAFLQSALLGLGAKPIARPDLDLMNSFNALAVAAGLGDTFDPYANEANFLIGGFIFEDVGVTAYRGGAKLLKSAAVTSAAAGILAVEAYHAATLRTALLGLSTQTGFEDVVDTIQAISDARDTLDGAGKDKDQGIQNDESGPNIVPTDENGLAFSRSTSEVLRIVYGGGTTSGAFFPSGVRGPIKSA